MFTANLVAIKFQQEEMQRRASHNRLVKSLETSRGFNGRLINRVANLVKANRQQAYTFSQAAH